MSALVVSDSDTLIQELEPILVSLYKSDNGKSPTLYELKQYIVSYASDKLADVLINSDSSVFKSMSSNEALSAVNFYIKKLRVW